MAHSGDVEVSHISEASCRLAFSQVTFIPSAISVQTISGDQAWITYQGWFKHSLSSITENWNISFYLVTRNLNGLRLITT